MIEMSSGDRPPIAQRELRLFQAITAASSITVAAIAVCIATMATGWSHGPMVILAVVASVAWTGVMALAGVLAVTKTVCELRDEILTDQRQRREDQIRGELVKDTGEMNVRRMSK